MAAAVPAVLYYFGMLMSVHFEAKKLGLKCIDKENITNELLEGLMLIFLMETTILIIMFS